MITVTAAYYGARSREGGGDGDKEGASDAGARPGEDLRAVIDVIDRASPGIVELASVGGGSGFDVRLAERPFPPEYEAELRRVAAALLARPGIASGPFAAPPGPSAAQPSLPPPPAPAAPPTGGPAGGLVVRLVRALRRMLSASA